MGKIMKIEEEAPGPIKEAVEKSDISINKGYQLTQKLRDLPEDEREAAALEMLEKAEAEYRKGCDETDRQCDIANLFIAAFDKIAQLDPTKENIWYWIDWCGIRPSDLDSLIWEAGVAAQKFNHIVETLTEAKELGDWRNPYAAKAQENSEANTESILDADSDTGAGRDAGDITEGEADQHGAG